MVKTAIAVFICYMIYYLRGQNGMPFYSVFTAIICVQTSIVNSFRTAIDRTIGTFIGGAFGVLILLVSEWTPLIRSYPPLLYLFISLFVIPLIYITVLIHRPNAAALTCVVFISIAAAGINDTDAAMFALNRMIDTLIGIFVSLVINALHPPVRRGRKMLFVMELDNVLLHSDGTLGTTTAVRLNQMLESGAMVTVVTNHAPATFMPLLESVKLRLPVIAVEGAALFNMEERRYEQCGYIPRQSVLRIRELFSGMSHNLFVSMIINEVQHVYYGDFTSPAEAEQCMLWRNRPGRYYIHSSPPDDHPVLCMTAADRAEIIGELKSALDEIAEECGVYSVLRPSADMPGTVILDIYRAGVSRRAAVMEMKARLKADTLVMIGSGEEDLPLLESADIGLAVAGACVRVREAADFVIGSNDTDSPARNMHRMFYWGAMKKRV